MGVRQTVLAAIAALCALSCALPGRALASATQRSILMDDDQLIYSSPAHVEHRLEQVAALGLDQVKISVVWSLVAPNASSSRRPSFDATDPAAYPYGAWDRYDRIVTIAQRLGLSVFFQLDPPAPQWALARGLPRGQGAPLGQAPNTSDFAQFAEAVGRRYSGSYSSQGTAVGSSGGTSAPLPGLGNTVTAGNPAQDGGAATTIPAVRIWSVWNEPNFPSWLNPWYRTLKNGRRELMQPPMYRTMVNAAWRGLAATGHAADTFLIGETANFGNVDPVPFIQDLYCLDSRSRPLSGSAASAVGCPTRADTAGFVAANPGLFHLTGFAHHPYGFDIAPSRPYPAKSWITLYNLGWLENVLRAVMAAYGRTQAVPLYMTEWGYKTRPPNPYVKTSLSQQAAWLNEGEFLTYENPYVQALAQFELVDSPPKAGEPPGTRDYWSSFQTGLLYQNGKPKPSYDTFRIPIWVPVARHGPAVTVWGQFRPADHSGLQYGTIQYRRGGHGSWQDIRTVQTASREGFSVSHVSLPAAGSVRLAWLDRIGTTYYSRAVAIQ